MKKRIYVLFSHEEEGTDFDVEFATTDAEEIIRHLKDFSDEEMHYADAFYAWCNEDMTAESLERHAQCEVGVDFAFDGLYRRPVLKSVDVEVTESGMVWGVFANGYEVYSWYGDMRGLFSSKEEAVDIIIRESDPSVFITQYDSSEEEAEDILHDLEELSVYMDDDLTYWSLIPFKVEE